MIRVSTDVSELPVSLKQAPNLSDHCLQFGGGDHPTRIVLYLNTAALNRLIEVLAASAGQATAKTIARAALTAAGLTPESLTDV